MSDPKVETSESAVKEAAVKVGFFKGISNWYHTGKNGHLSQAKVVGTGVVVGAAVGTVIGVMRQRKNRSESGVPVVIA